MKAKLNDYKLTVIPGFWRNTKVRIFLFRIIELGAGMETLVANILKVRTERFPPLLSSGILELIPDKSIRVHLVEISPTMPVSREANIRNGDRTNVQVHWHDTIKKL